MSVETIVGPSKSKPSSEKEALRDSVEELILAVRTLISVFEKAKDEIKAEPTQQVLMKLDELTIYNKQLIEQNREVLEQTGKLLQQNKDVAHSLLMLLDLHREHLPEIAKHTRLTSEVRRVQPSGYHGAAFARTRRPRLPMENREPDTGQPESILHP
ncbi:hypothetical protein HYU17_01345 [Candidatus Woesearchaeota archaeon]|nr:hypothetical protein [Candidatus Woesearchaeota archaeon]